MNQKESKKISEQSQNQVPQNNNNLSLAKEYENWITFFLNYLSPYFSENDFPLFKKRWHSYWKLFQLWKAKKLENEEIKETVKQLISTQKPLSYLIRRYQQKETIDNSFLNSELEKIWHDNDKNADLTEKYLAKPQKFQNFFLGQIKRKLLLFNINIQKRQVFFANSSSGLWCFTVYKVPVAFPWLTIL